MDFPTEMMHDSIWFERPKYEFEMQNYQMFLTNNLSMHLAQSHAPAAVSQSKAPSSLSQEISKARDAIKQTLSTPKTSQRSVSELESENNALKKTVEDMTKQISALQCRVNELNAGRNPVAPVKKVKDDSDDDLFSSEEEEEETEEQKRIKEERVAAYHAKKANKKTIIAKSSLLLDVKPWDDETDMKVLEKKVRTIAKDGLLWGASKLVPVGYGIKKLQISAVIEDEKICTEWLEEEITKFEDHVQSMDIAAFNKI